jgi:hypothetical protein
MKVHAEGTKSLQKFIAKTPTALIFIARFLALPEGVLTMGRKREELMFYVPR